MFAEILKNSNNEDALRLDESKVGELPIMVVPISELQYVKTSFDGKLVLTGSKTKDTITSDEFNMEFSKKTFDLLTYINWNNIVVAGGALVNIITKNKDKLSDVDLFVYGLDLESAKNKIDHVINSIKMKAHDMKYETRIYMNSNVINIYVFDTKKLLQIQVILRLYNTLSHVLAGFDVDCCCVAYNSKDLLVTQRGLYALKYRVNLASLTRRSPSYENRLIKYSFRGFDVITDFEYQNLYNKMFFMTSNNYGFTRLLEQELINNGQLRNIIFSNTLRFRKNSSYTKGHSCYAKENPDVKDIRNTENSITKYNANIEDDTMKFREYNIRNIELMQFNVTEQFTGSFHPITGEDWINGKSEETKAEELGEDYEDDCTDDDTYDSNVGEKEVDKSIPEKAIFSDPLNRSKEFIRLKYNMYEDIAEFENKEILDMSNFDAKCLAVMYVNNENDVVRIVENKYIQKSTNMYKVNPVHLAILFGRTKLAMSLMKGHSYETYRELIYMMDNDKLFTNYCNSVGRSCTDVDKTLIAKFDCINISDNIHNQNKGVNNLDEFYLMTDIQKYLHMTTIIDTKSYYHLDITKVSFDVIKLLFEKGAFHFDDLVRKYIIRQFNQDELNTYVGLMTTPNEIAVFSFVVFNFNKTESWKCKTTNDNVKKLLQMKNLWKDTMNTVSVCTELMNLNIVHPNLYVCMLNVFEMTYQDITKLIGNANKAFDMLISYILFLDDVSLLQKLIPKDDIYVKLKYHYRVESTGGTNVLAFFKVIDTDRQNDKVKTNKAIMNTDFHTNAITDGELPENYERMENVFGMTPDDNIMAKLLLMYNKIFNKRENMSDKDLSTLKNLRKSVNNIRRNSEYNVVNHDYFYSLDLHDLFFARTDESQTQAPEVVSEVDTSMMAETEVYVEEDDI